MRWNGSGWEDISGEIDSLVSVLAFDSQDQLIVGGYFSSIGGVTAQNIARWDGQMWEALCDCAVNMPTSLLIDGDTVYIGSTTIQKIDNGTLEMIGGLFGNPDHEITSVRALALDKKGRLITGGEFTKVGQMDANNIALWNGMAWHEKGWAAVLS